MANIADVKFDNLKFTKMIHGTIAENARSLGVTRQHLHNIMRGRRLPSAPLLLKIQQVYQVGSSDLIKKT